MNLPNPPHFPPFFCPIIPKPRIAVFIRNHRVAVQSCGRPIDHVDHPLSLKVCSFSVSDLSLFLTWCCCFLDTPPYTRCFLRAIPVFPIPGWDMHLFWVILWSVLAVAPASPTLRPCGDFLSGSVVSSSDPCFDMNAALYFSSPSRLPFPFKLALPRTVF